MPDEEEEDTNGYQGVDDDFAGGRGLRQLVAAGGNATAHAAGRKYSIVGENMVHVGDSESGADEVDLANAELGVVRVAAGRLTVIGDKDFICCMVPNHRQQKKDYVN